MGMSQVKSMFMPDSEVIYDPEEYEGSGLFIFGRDVMAVPCLRPSVLVALGAGFTVGFGHFVFTSHGSRSLRLSIITFSLVAFPCCYVCQQRRYKKLETILDMKESLNKNKDKEEFVAAQSLEDSLDFSVQRWG